MHYTAQLTVQLGVFYGANLTPLCAVPRRDFSVGANPTRQLVVPAGSNRSGSGGNETVEAFDGKGRLSDSASRQAVT